MSALADFPLVEPTRRGTPGCTRAPRSVVSLLSQANRALLDAEWEPDSGLRFASAYTAALRAAAAMLAFGGRPHRGRAKPTSAWVLLERTAPELAEWAGFFAAASSTNAAIASGMTRTVPVKTADDLVRQASRFLALVERTVADGAC